ncbi:MAG: YbaB/EbfC family nucleoid-associated protein [Coriobacteriia bacterium]|nr:YbaB/EbfC family nucleoid-associated protein [Coriobacteriia bacterium]MCL2606211.1 YbaB/EbfC family nucleoid-associated protein [Coriobacteriia bacterium]
MNIQKLMKQAQQAQAQMAAVQQELAQETVEASAGGGMVKVVMTCDRQLRDIIIDPDAVDPEEVELLQDMILAAINEASRIAEETAATKMEAVTGGLDIPGL